MAKILTVARLQKLTGLKGIEMAAKLGVTPTVISSWKRNGIPAKRQAIVRTLLPVTATRKPAGKKLYDKRRYEGHDHQKAVGTEHFNAELNPLDTFTVILGDNGIPNDRKMGMLKGYFVAS
jgi:uncharacterized protein YjcR